MELNHKPETTNDKRGRWIGRAVRRVEDPRVLTGRGTYVDDLHPPRMVEVAFVRSPHAHARLARVDAERARRHPGVVAVLTGAVAARPSRLGPRGGPRACVAFASAGAFPANEALRAG